MKVQAARLRDGSLAYLVLDDEFGPIEPALAYLRHLRALQRSPNTLRAAAFDLKLFFEFLEQRALEWSAVGFEDLSGFALWLTEPAPGVLALRESESPRTERTINRVLQTLSGFYEFYERAGLETLNLISQKRQVFTRYKSFLHHAKRSVTSRHRALKLREPRKFPGCLSKEQVTELVSACAALRDKLLLCLLYESGLRIGEALSLRHEDMLSGKQNAVRVVPRNAPQLSSRNKSRFERKVDVSVRLMRLYSAYLINEYPEESMLDHVFVCGDGAGGFQPLTYSAVDALFRRLKRQTGIYATPHLFRHAHATELIRDGWNIGFVQKRLGHAQLQTTISTYLHLSDSDLERAYRENPVEFYDCSTTVDPV